MTVRYIDSDTGLEVLEKQPSESRVFFMDTSNLLDGARPTTITSVVATNLARVVGSTNVVVSDVSAVPEGAMFRIAGGTTGEAYKITVTLVTSRGDTIQAEGVLYCKDL